MHPLKDYLRRSGISYGTFAGRIGAANEGVVAKYCNGSRVPRPKFMKAIARETAGEITANHFHTAAEAE